MMERKCRVAGWAEVALLVGLLEGKPRTAFLAEVQLQSLSRLSTSFYAAAAEAAID